MSNANIVLPNILPFRFISALLTKPFVILTGLAGSGKTKVAEALSLWISEQDSQHCMVSVGADWTNREPLLGFPNALEQGKYVKPDSGVLDLILEAVKPENKHRPYFLILDEMNMSHVERYFADFLSAMESVDRTIALHSTGEWKDSVPHEVTLPENLFIIGTLTLYIDSFFSLLCSAILPRCVQGTLNRAYITINKFPNKGFSDRINSYISHIHFTDFSRQFLLDHK